MEVENERIDACCGGSGADEVWEGEGEGASNKGGSFVMCTVRDAMCEQEKERQARSRPSYWRTRFRREHHKSGAIEAAQQKREMGQRTWTRVVRLTVVRSACSVVRADAARLKLEMARNRPAIAEQIETYTW